MAQKLPKCSKWNIWRGAECEGEEDFGKSTLFVRKMGLNDVFLFQAYKRIWFTKEFKNKVIIRKALKMNCKVCLEVTSETINHFDNALLSKCVVYLKLPKKIKEGDHIKFGEPFSETLIKLKVNKTKKSLYNSDKRIK